MLSILPIVLVLAAWLFELRVLAWVAIPIASLSMIATLRARPDDFGRSLLPSGRIWQFGFPVMLAASLVTWAVGVALDVPTIAMAALPLGTLTLISFEMLRRNSYRIG